MGPGRGVSIQPFADLATAAYCPRKLYYRRRDDDRTPPPDVERVRDVAFRYPRLLADPSRLDDEPIAVPADEWCRNLERARDHPYWPAVVDPVDRNVVAVGRRSAGVVHKVLDLETPVPGVVSAGTPPDRGVWEPDAVRGVAAAKALSWEHGVDVGRAIVEYPAVGVVRAVDLTTRRTAAYRRALRVAESLDGPPPRLSNRAKCGACEYRETCGVRTYSLGSRLP